MAGLAAGCAVAAMGLAPAHAAAGKPSAAGAERIIRYLVRITIRSDASVLVNEQIVYDFGSDRRHGIYREIPVVYSHGRYNDRYLSLAVRSVTSAGGAVPYEVSYPDDSVEIKVGDPDHTVTGVHAYSLTYLVKGAMSVVRGYDELVWNAVGDQWAVPIGLARVVVTGPVAPYGVTCLTGPYGSTARCGRAAAPDDRSTAFVQLRLGPHDDMTVAIDLPAGAVSVPPPLLRERWRWQRAFALTPVTEGVAGGLFAVLLLVIVPFVGVRRRRWHARPGPKPGGAAPPENLRPGQVGTLIDGVANPRDFAATICDLAARGYLTIEPTGENPPDWRLTRLDKDDGLLEYENILLTGLFTDPQSGAALRRRHLTALDGGFTATLRQAERALYADVVSRGWFAARPDKTRLAWRVVASVMVVGGLLATVLLAASTRLGLVPVPVVVAGLVLAGSAQWLPKRTEKGDALAASVLRFGRSIAGEAAAGPGAERAGVLFGYLPYAITFGCSAAWEGLGRAAFDDGTSPSWFVGRPFGAAELARAGQYFSTVHYDAIAANALVRSFFAANHRYRNLGAHRGFSGGGFSGGGFSGGGFGGGGGGSW
jgi:uncharacterized membrane protein YgcG